MLPRTSFPSGRLLQGGVAVAASVALMAGSAWACPPEPENTKTQTGQAAATAGEGAGGHAGHYRRAAPASTRSEAVKGVRRVGGVSDAKGAISLMFMDYGRGPHKRTIMYATGQFGLKAYDISADPRVP